LSSLDGLLWSEILPLTAILFQLIHSHPPTNNLFTQFFTAKSPPTIQLLLLQFKLFPALRLLLAQKVLALCFSSLLKSPLSPVWGLAEHLVPGSAFFHTIKPDLSKTSPPPPFPNRFSPLGFPRLFNDCDPFSNGQLPTSASDVPLSPTFDLFFSP